MWIKGITRFLFFDYLFKSFIIVFLSSVQSLNLEITKDYISTSLKLRWRYWSFISSHNLLNKKACYDKNCSFSLSKSEISNIRQRLGLNITFLSLLHKIQIAKAMFIHWTCFNTSEKLFLWLFWRFINDILFKNTFNEAISNLAESIEIFSWITKNRTSTRGLHLFRVQLIYIKNSSNFID